MWGRENRYEGLCEEVIEGEGEDVLWYMYMFIYTCTCVHVYIEWNRGKEEETKGNTHTYIYTCTHATQIANILLDSNTCMYIHVYGRCLLHTIMTILDST